MLLSPVHKAMFATQTILNTPKLNREAAKIGQTCEATSEGQMPISAVHKTMFATGKLWGL